MPGLFGAFRPASAGVSRFLSRSAFVLIPVIVLSRQRSSKKCKKNEKNNFLFFVAWGQPEVPTSIVVC